MTTNNNLKKRPIFNFNGSDKFEDKELFNGNPTGIANVNEQKYVFAERFYDSYEKNVWFPKEVSLAHDVNTLKQCTRYELTALKSTLSFLIFLDSAQCTSLPNIASYITDPDVADSMRLQTAQEVIHSKSYQYILNSLFSFSERDEIYNAWKNDDVLLKRINWVADIATEFERNPTKENMKKVLAVTYVLEGIFFYHGFAFFYHLNHRGILTGSSEIIDYIESDELTHVDFFGEVINAVFDEVDYLMLIDVIKTAVAHEIEWSKHIYGNSKILGISYESIELYIKYLANERCKLVGITSIYPNITNPYQFLNDNKKKDFFDGTVTDYDKPNSFKGWDELMTMEINY